MLFFQFLKPTDMYAGSLFFSAVNFDLCFRKTKCIFVRILLLLSMMICSSSSVHVFSTFSLVPLLLFHWSTDFMIAKWSFIGDTIEGTPVKTSFFKKFLQKEKKSYNKCFFLIYFFNLFKQLLSMKVIFSFLLYTLFL